MSSAIQRLIVMWTKSWRVMAVLMSGIGGKEASMPKRAARRPISR